MNKKNQNLINEINNHHKEITPLMIDIDNKFKNKTNLNTDKYYRYLKKPDKITKNGYITIIFGDSKYLPGILVSGYFIKHICKSKFNIICLVQDNPYYENGILKFEGLTTDEIEDIKKIYDVVIGIDVLVNYQHTNHHHSKNISYYITKILVLGLTLYKKLFYYDSSTTILKNIDYYFTKYNKSTYRNLSFKIGAIIFSPTSIIILYMGAI
jgi:alpha-N-acetylglucosamine transferase